MSSPRQQQESVAERIASNCLAVRVRLLNRKITSIYDEALRPIGLTTGQLNILVIVSNRGPIAQTEIAASLQMEKSTLSRNLERMRAHGWINSATRRSGRGLELRIQSKGRKLLERAFPLWKQAQTRSESVLGQRGVQSLHSAADHIWAQSGHE